MSVDVLFTFDEWQILSDTDYIEVFACHNVCQEVDGDGQNRAWFSDEKPAVCIYCGLDLPDEVQGLVHMLRAGV